jgi:hypothetical protein
MRSKHDQTFVKHIDGAGYGAGEPKPIMDEDDALEQAEADIRRLKALLLVAVSLATEAKPAMTMLSGGDIPNWVTNFEKLQALTSNEL